MSTPNLVLFSFWKSMGIPQPVMEYRFHTVRLWRFDYCWPERKVALEVQGGIWIQGRHSRGAALLKEWDKLNSAAAMGYRIVFCQPSDILTVRLAKVILEVLKYED